MKYDSIHSAIRQTAFWRGLVEFFFSRVCIGTGWERNAIDTKGKAIHEFFIWERRIAIYPFEERRSGPREPAPSYVVQI